MNNNPRSDFINFAKEKLDIIVDPFDIVQIHKLPSKKNYKTIVKFHFHDTKFNIFKNCKKLKNTNIYINEHLTKINSDIFYKARSLYKEKKIFSCWTTNGVTFIKIKVNSIKTKISKITDYNELFQL